MSWLSLDLEKETLAFHLGFFTLCPTYICRFTSFDPFSHTLGSNTTHPSPFAFCGHTLPRALFYHVLSVGPVLCPFDSFCSYLVSPYCAPALAWGSGVAALKQQRHDPVSTSPNCSFSSRPSQTCQVFPFYFQLEAFFTSLHAARASFLRICHGIYPLFLLHSFYLWMELTFLPRFSRKQGL